MIVLTRREASIFACLCDTVVAPEPPLPPCATPTRSSSFDRWLAASPALNRSASGYCCTSPSWRRAARPGAGCAGCRGSARQALPGPRPPGPSRSSRPSSHGPLAYYGDDGVMRTLGYDPDARATGAGVTAIRVDACVIGTGAGGGPVAASWPRAA